ncbi:glycosyl transferase (plasmid) [Pseudorhodobacter turbinis]|uniref:Peptide O-xylosyltransferase n=1 Tax=Pseudorhodobacter turbinis TaxID=2500533 RepID=A0A4P8EKN7_9RHOB|nr:DUF5928 domain-containing protein [Pseudorhodobacter turbinis]QCO57627.1 glycosyl transferase [Pseudorhodobacter turbinis]
MAKIAYILLCHKDPDGVIAQANRLTDGGDYIVIHFDARAKASDFDRIRLKLAGNSSVVFTPRRLKCDWGGWSLVAATLLSVRTAVDAFPLATHFYMLSGDCMPIRSAEFMHAFLAPAKTDYIESFDFFKSDWIRTGIKEERLIYRHWFNERTQKKLFYTSLQIQQQLGLKRNPPSDLDIQIGSQWWCLRRNTIEILLAFCDERPDVIRFFRTTWIPDETFFQTLVRHLIPQSEIETRTLTFLMFTDYGMPVTFYNDHYNLLLSQNYLFARKISDEAVELKERLGKLYSAKGERFSISDEGRTLFEFLTARGRIGRRFTPRFWETGNSLGRDRTLLMVISKKWHVAKRLAERIRSVTGMPTVDYLFNEAETPLPDLGGIQSSLEKRTRHRRALVRMLYDYWQTDTLIMCIDPANIDLMHDFASDRSTLRLLEVECEFSDPYLIGHAGRVNLAGDNTPPEVINSLLTTIRQDLRFESDRIRDANFNNLQRLRETAPIAENAMALAAFLGIPPESAREIAQTEDLFGD